MRMFDPCQVLKKGSSSTRESTVGSTSTQSLLVMHTRNRLKTRSHFTVAFWVCFSDINCVLPCTQTLNWNTVLVSLGPCWFIELCLRSCSVLLCAFSSCRVCIFFFCFALSCLGPVKSLFCSFSSTTFMLVLSSLSLPDRNLTVRHWW